MPPSESIAVLLNADAGTASGRPQIATELAELFRALGREAEIIVLPHGQDPLEAARSAGARSTIVAAAGGDGTVCGVAAGLVGRTRRAGGPAAWDAQSLRQGSAHPARSRQGGWRSSPPVTPLESTSASSTTASS